VIVKKIQSHILMNSKAYGNDDASQGLSENLMPKKLTLFAILEH
jgi:hypothetical protein